MKVTITIDTDNAAFGNGYGSVARAECRRILMAAFSKMRRHKLIDLDGGILRDANGNTVGNITVGG